MGDRCSINISKSEFEQWAQIRCLCLANGFVLKKIIQMKRKQSKHNELTKILM